MELLIEGYKRAKQKGYIRDNKKQINKNFNNNGFYPQRAFMRGNNNQYWNNYGQQRYIYPNYQQRVNYGNRYVY